MATLSADTPNAEARQPIIRSQRVLDAERAVTHAHAKLAEEEKVLDSLKIRLKTLREEDEAKISKGDLDVDPMLTVAHERVAKQVEMVERGQQAVQAAKDRLKTIEQKAPSADELLEHQDRMQALLDAMLESVQEFEKARAEAAAYSAHLSGGLGGHVGLDTLRPVLEGMADFTFKVRTFYESPSVRSWTYQH